MGAAQWEEQANERLGGGAAAGVVLNTDECLEPQQQPKKTKRLD